MAPGLKTEVFPDNSVSTQSSAEPPIPVLKSNEVGALPTFSTVNKTGVTFPGFTGITGGDAGGDTLARRRSPAITKLFADN
ncbi:MAG: Uncharacterised protein [Methanobacteriota archaeon]|nr:MAG: Uncharacterised protein [Euryarchaeota archaeon]